MSLASLPVLSVFTVSVTSSNPTESDPVRLLVTIQFNLSSLVQSCLVNGDRSIAHRCARLIALCLELVFRFLAVLIFLMV
jgi:hypothetical protein